MRMRGVRRFLGSVASCSALLLGGFFLAAPEPVHADWAGSSAITTWSGECNGSTRDYWDDMCMNWRNTMNDLGWIDWHRNFSQVKGKRYADDSVKAWGIDDTDEGLDWNEAGMMCLHGGWKKGFWKGTLYNPDADGSCAATASKMRVGRYSGGYMKFLHLSSCNSIRYSQRTQWFDAADGVLLVTGFHGLMYIGYWYVGEYGSLAAEGMSSRGVGKTWVTDMHHVNHWYNVYKTVCPVSAAFGKSATQARNRQNHKYGTSWVDSEASHMNVRFISECDPDDGPPMPK